LVPPDGDILAPVVTTRQPLRQILMEITGPDGEPDGWRLVTATPRRADDGSVREVLYTFADIKDRVFIEQHLEHRLLHDPLTDLPNRGLFLDRLLQAVERAQHDGTVLAVLVMDVDHFKEINGAFGYTYGDVLLQQIGARLRAA